MRVNENVKGLFDDKRVLHDAIDDVADYVIHQNEETGEIVYRPYLLEDAITVSILTNMVDGIEIEDGDGLYTLPSAIEENKELADIMTDLKNKYYEEIETMADFIVTFKEGQYATVPPSLQSLLTQIAEKEIALQDFNMELLKKQANALDQEARINEYQEKVNELMTPEETAELNKKLLEGELSADALAETIVEKYAESPLNARRATEIVDAKNDKIKELEAFKQAHTTANNVLRDK